MTRPLHDRIRPGRRITGMSAVLLPFDSSGAVDWSAFDAHLGFTVDAGLLPAVNMDTGFGPELSDEVRTQVLDHAVAVARDGFVAGAHVRDDPGAQLDVNGYRAAIAAIADRGGLPILFPSYGLAAVPEGALADAHARIVEGTDRVLAFELGTMFHPAGRIWSRDTFAAILDVPQIAGAKHSSLSRVEEWDRLAVRDRLRPDFLLLTGNDLAIDMVVYGSDYLLGLSTFAPDAFAARDAAWSDGDEARFWAINDALQYLGRLAFRAPVPGYRHDAAMFLALRGRLECDATHPSSPARPASDRALMAPVLDELAALGALSP